MSTLRSRALAASLTLPALAGAGALAPSAEASTPTHVYEHGGYNQAHFASAADCTSHLSSAVKVIKSKGASSVAYGPCHTVAPSLATTSGHYTYNVTYRSKSRVWSSDADLGANPATSVNQHSFYETGHATTLAAANAAIAAAKSHVTHTMGARVTWSSGAIKSKTGGYVWEVDSTSRYTPSTSAIESSQNPGVTNVLLLNKTSGTTSPTDGAISKGVTGPGGAAAGWTSGTTNPSQPANPTSPSQTTTSGSSKTTVTTQPGSGTVTSTTTSGSSRTSEKIGVAGIDVSNYTKLSNYAAWKAKGINFIISKATEGTYFTNSKHAAQMSGARSAGIYAGSYDFANPANNSAKAEADYYLAHGGGWKPNSGMLPDSLDIEYNPYGATCYGMSKSALTQWTNDWVSEVHARTGSYPFVYSTNGWVNQCLNPSAINPHTKLWLAKYTSTPGSIPQPWSYQTIWQNAAIGSQGYDTDIFNGTLSGLKKFSDNGIQ